MSSRRIEWWDSPNPHRTNTHQKRRRAAAGLGASHDKYGVPVRPVSAGGSQGTSSRGTAKSPRIEMYSLQAKATPYILSRFEAPASQAPWSGRIPTPNRMRSLEKKRCDRRCGMRDRHGRNAGGGTATKWPRRNLNLPLAARPRVGHIRSHGAVAEWLKAAVC